MIQPLSATSRVMKIGLTTSDPELDLIDLSMAAYWNIRTRLLRVPGVANVPIWGERLEMPTIQVDPERPERKMSRRRRSRRPWPLPRPGTAPDSRGPVHRSGGWIEGATTDTGLQ